MSDKPHHLLLVEDDTELSGMMKDFLTGKGYQVSVEADGLAAIRRIASEAYDAVILDIGLPGTDGFSVCKSVRPHFKGPIIVLTARGEELDEVVALEAGADDFMSKPVRPNALLARLKIHLRRFDLQPADSSVKPADIVVGDLSISLGSRSVVVGDQPIELTTAEFDLIEYLARRAGSVVSRKELYVDLLEIPYDGMDRSLDLRVSRLRRKLGDDPHKPTRIKSVRGVGYLFAK
ncbi:response regulator transcription factor [Stieleria sp. ICT_E10.1]|uniref:response regulator transcription factor n=1 Tax=Stieleria sedimenti TaxID=2976331 RepID=UPI00217FD903|nr:response regulator transcription factor [Stieleria sedimenti]MCS7470671.1 response regulator transcription factor [Stieleria sedimenti]